MTAETEMCFGLRWGSAPDPAAACAAYRVECPCSAFRSGMNRPRLRSARCRFSLRYSLRLRDWTGLLDYSTELKATRKPRKLSRSLGRNLTRDAERQSPAV